MTPSATLSQFSADLEALVARAAPAVVGVRSGPVVASGTVVSGDRVVMADHGLDHGFELEAGGIDVWANGTARAARLLGRDSSSDLAVLQVDGLDVAPLVTGTQPQVGALVVSVGRAWERLLAHVGVVHTKGPLPRRRGPRLDGVLRTTITPYPGYSGGPLLDAHGRIVGITTAGLQRAAGLALPWEAVARIVEEIATHGRIRRGFLGVSSMPVALAPGQQGPKGERAGLLVTSVVPDGPAAAAGVLVGDILTDFDGQAVPEPDALVVLLTGERVGRTASVSVVRGAATLVLSVTVGERATRHQ